jgi:GT2 family glycosyltransferase
MDSILQNNQHPNLPLVSIVIPHIGSSDILYTCLQSVAKSSYPFLEIVLVDNGSDFQEEWLQESGLSYIYIKNKRNIGFAGGCNAGIKRATGKYLVLLNNDTQVDAGWLEPLVQAMEENPKLAACQPRLLSSRFEGKFDYGGAMGGLMDIFGYPFAIGRIFNTIESEHDRYQCSYRIFWASGTASIWRKSVFAEVGYLDEDFFAHQEEIDLNWRCQLAGYQVRSIHGSRIYHYSGYSLGHENWRKIYLNHRNNLVMLLKNYEGNMLVWLFPIRIFMEIVTIFMAVVSLNWKQLWAIICAHFYLIMNSTKIWRKRKSIQSLRRIGDPKIYSYMFRGSVVWQYFVRHRRSVGEFMELTCK